MEGTPKYWHDKDQPPYTEGENPYYDRVLNELTEYMLEQVKQGKFKEKSIASWEDR